MSKKNTQLLSMYKHQQKHENRHYFMNSDTSMCGFPNSEFSRRESLRLKHTDTQGHPLQPFRRSPTPQMVRGVVSALRAQVRTRSKCARARRFRLRAACSPSCYTSPQHVRTTYVHM